MKPKIVLCSFVASLAFSTQVYAKPPSHTDVAKVTHVEPVYQTVERRIPRETCWMETVRSEDPRLHRRSATPVILGSVIGGLVGKELGNNRDKRRIGAVVGSILGASIANDIQRQQPRHQNGAQYEEIERCEISHSIETEQVLEGYNVDYRFHGRNYSTFMEQRPGKTIPIAVQVRALPH